MTETRKQRSVFFLQLLSIVVLNSATQVFLKLAAILSGETGLLSLLNGWLFLAFGCLAISFILWTSLVGKKPLSFLHPFCALPLCVVPIFSYILFGEKPGFFYYAGLALVLAGIYLTASSAQSPDEKQPRDAI
jgi:undecaprenyl phosphate-alpha-L-ara4N flippase subunit ArnE